MMKLGHFVVEIVWVLFCVGYLHAAEPTRPSQPGQVVQAGTGQQSLYLPLAKGNQWVYRRTVSERGEVFAIRPASGGPGMGRGNTRLEPGISEETYLVEDQLTDNTGTLSWRIKVMGTAARDGRYGGSAVIREELERIVWGRDLQYQEAMVMTETLALPVSVFLGARRTQLPLVIDPLRENVPATLAWEHFGVEYTVTGRRVQVTVPAGKFTRCLEMVTTVKPLQDAMASAKLETMAGLAQGWTTYAYYTPGVGLVKEVQKDARGHPTYTLELLRYDVR